MYVYTNLIRLFAINSTPKFSSIFQRYGVFEECMIKYRYYQQWVDIFSALMAAWKKMNVKFKSHNRYQILSRFVLPRHYDVGSVSPSSGKWEMGFSHEVHSMQLFESTKDRKMSSRIRNVLLYTFTTNSKVKRPGATEKTWPQRYTHPYPYSWCIVSPVRNWKILQQQNKQNILSVYSIIYYFHCSQRGITYEH